MFPLFSGAQSDSLIRADEFNGTGMPDPTFWRYDLGTNNGWGNNEIQNYTAAAANVRQDSGHLIIEARKTDGVWTSARIQSHGLVNFTYGKIVFSARLPKGIGTWPALWLLGESFTTAGWPACGEIDVMEHVGKDPGVIHSSLHTTSSSGNTINTQITRVDTYATHFHQYMMNWTPDRIEFSVDSVLFYTYSPYPRTADVWPFTKPFFIIMNIAMGGNFGSDPLYETGGLKNGVDPALTLARMEVDYVRIYKRVTASGTGDLEPGAVKEGPGMWFRPNPATRNITINTGHTSVSGCRICTVTGTPVLEIPRPENGQTVDLSSLPKGLYLFTCTTREGELHYQKLVLN